MSLTQHSISRIELVNYEEKHNEVLYSFQLPPEQGQFTGLPQEMLPVIKESAWKVPIVIMHNEIPVGFFILETGQRVKDHTDEAHAMLLTAFSIDHRHQGQGFAKQGLLLLPDFVSRHFAEIREVVLAVNHKNTAAFHLYTKVGFQDQGKRRIGPLGEQIILHLPITKNI